MRNLFILIKSGAPSKLNFLFLFFFFGQWAILIGPSPKKQLKIWSLPKKIEDFVGRWSACPLAQLYRMKEDNFGQSIWDKSVVLLGTSWGTHWELDGNNKKSKNSIPALPPSPKKKKPWASWCMLHCLIRIPIPSFVCLSPFSS